MLFIFTKRKHISGCWKNGELGSMPYIGNMSMTENGRICQRWDEQSPHKHTYTTREVFPDGQMSHNYCRQLDRDYIWCFTTDPRKIWEECEVPSCGKLISLFRNSCMYNHDICPEK